MRIFTFQASYKIVSLTRCMVLFKYEILIYVLFYGQAMYLILNKQRIPFI